MHQDKTPNGTDPVSASAPPKEAPGTKLLLELGPLLVFFFTNLRGAWLIEHFPALGQLGGPLFVASAAFMVATLISLTVSKMVYRHLPLMPLVSGAIVIVFGALGLYLQNEVFFKMKGTIINTLFGVALLGGLLFGKSLLGHVFNSAFQLDDAGWKKLTFRWGVFFLFLAALNEIVWRNFSDDTWVAFKVWGTMPITVLFTLSQMPLILRHSLEGKEDA
ncbi:intracellular septation protein [Gellertiella hungarica]|uniref:Inner membrane-spanning protein YciB n=2 Tax=Gellertiella hungarica TaxID=1572859 RepID=A0A7W6NL74_9HYPH|nr:septation protein A [Gellertiella hungarica]MBB4065274.1 intracellular septation protein [Gellertiella hungarica]